MQPCFASTTILLRVIHRVFWQWMQHQLDAIQVHRFPGRIPGIEIHPLLIGCIENHGGLPIFEMLADSFPQFFPHFGRNTPYIYACIDFTEPFCQVAPQAGRTVGNSNHNHDFSPAISWYCFPLATVPNRLSHK